MGRDIKSGPMFIGTMQALIKEFMSSLGEHYNIDAPIEVQVFQAAGMPKVIVRAIGNFGSIEDIMDATWDASR